MNKRGQRTLEELCDATPTLSLPQITPILRGIFSMQGPVDEANCDLLTHMVTLGNGKGFSSSSDRSQKLDYIGKSGTCNVCSAPCSSCFHVNKILMKSNDEFVGETSAENIGIVQPNVRSTVAGMNSTSDSFSENAAGKASSRTSNTSASDDERQGVPEGGHNDCLSCISGTDEHASKKSDTEYSRIKNNMLSKNSGESSDIKVPPTSSQTGLYSESSSLMEIISSKPTNDATKSSNGKYLSRDRNQGDVKDINPSHTKPELLEGSSGQLDSLPLKRIASDFSSDPAATALNSVEKNDDLEVEVHPTDETDDSDMVEQDVKVCDTCGDGGVEDLLAICCRCSDGAEHTYCMREMLAEVPEGEWLCEECKAVERVRNGRQGRIGKMVENEKNNSSGQASSEHANGSDVEGQRTKGLVKIPSKRHRDNDDDDDAEVSSVVKKPALESVLGSPKTSDSSKIAALSRENSLKNLDKGRLHSTHHSSSDTVPVNGNTELASSASGKMLNYRGTFSKSNSCNALNSKPKVQLVDQAVLRRQKSSKEHGSFRLKEGIGRSIGKSMSFKTTNSSRSESKIKMISPRLSHIPDIKSTKPRSPFERQRSFKAEYSSINSVLGTSTSSASRIDKRPASRGESSSLTHNELKPIQADGKSTALSRSSSLSARRTADSSSSLGEFKRPSIYGHSTLRASSVNGVIEEKPNQTSPKEDPPSCPVVADRPPFNANGCLPDGLHRSKDLTNSGGERMREYSGSRNRAPPFVKSSRNESDNLRAAIEAAVLRKPGVYGKHRASGQSDDLSVSTASRDVASHQDNIASFARKKKMSSVAELPERPTVSRNSSIESLKHETTNNVKQSSLVPVESLSSGGQDDVRVDLSSRGVFSDIPAAMPSFLKYLAIPEHEYIWQGSFEICRSGKPFDSWDGIQAHLSTCASPKVIEAVNKFKSKIVLYEVPRLSTWPVQFQEHGVRDDNIALFFFAKDIESYDKIYKVLLDNMMKHDLALKGNVNGVELLIFPSNQLPDNWQRWNMLFFLWGVFRGKKESCLQHMPESLDQFCAPPNIPPPIMSLSENRCSHKPISEDLASEYAAPVLEVPAAEKLRNALSSRVVNGDFDTKVPSLDRLHHKLNPLFSPAEQSDSEKQCEDIRCISQDGGISSNCSPLPLAVRSDSSGREQMLLSFNAPLDRQQSSHHSIKSAVGNQNQVNLEMDAEDPSSDMDIDMPLEDKPDTRDPKWLVNHKEPMPFVGPRSLFDGIGQVMLKIDEPHNGTCGTLEKMNHAPSSSYALPNRHHEACAETLNPECNERHLFPMDVQPVKGINLTEGNLLEQDRLNDRAPNLELALGAERKPLTLDFGPLLVGKLDQKVNEGHILEEKGTKAEDDVSASLSLSLSFPFPD